MTQAETSFERFLALVRGLGSQRDTPSVVMYERLKRDFIRSCPDASSEQYERAMRAIATACGV